MKTVLYYIYRKKLQIYDIEYNKYKLHYYIFKFFIYTIWILLAQKKSCASINSFINWVFFLNTSFFYQIIIKNLKLLF